MSTFSSTVLEDLIEIIQQEKQDRAANSLATLWSRTCGFFFRALAEKPLLDRSGLDQNHGSDLVERRDHVHESCVSTVYCPKP